MCPLAFVLVAALSPGDGPAGDVAALRAAVAAGGAVAVPAGTYRLTEPLEVDLAAAGRTALSGGGAVRLVMAGPGPAVRFVGTHDGTASPDSVRPEVWANENAPMLDGFEIVGEHPDADGVEATGTMQLTLSRVVVRRCRHAVRLTGRNRNVTLAACHLYENRGIGLFLDGTNLHQINVSACHVSYNAGGGVVARGSELRNLQLTGCDIEGNVPPSAADRDLPEEGVNAADARDPAADGPANVDLDGTDPALGEVAIVGCTIQHAHGTPGSANVRIRGRGPALRWTDERRHGNVTIADNVLSDVRVNLDLRGVRGATITGNTVWKGYDADVRLTNCAAVALTGNVFDRAPTYHYGDGARAKRGVTIADCEGVTLTGNQFRGTVSGEAALVLRNSRRMTITGNAILDHGGTGLLLDGVTASLVTGNLVRDDRDGADGAALRTEGESDVIYGANRFGNSDTVPRP